MVALWAFLAHQGGWDEFLLVLGPIAVIAAALAVAKRRVDAQAGEREMTEDHVWGDDQR